MDWSTSAQCDGKHPVIRYLRHLIFSKKSNLCVSADITSAKDMLSLAREVGPSIVVFKTHADILSGWDFTPNTGTGAQLATMARKYRFLVFEDRKFADIGFTAQLQYAGGDYRILEWAHIVNAHIISGSEMVRALAETARTWVEDQKELKQPIQAPNDEHLFPTIPEPPAERALLLLAQMSTVDNFLDEKYTKSCVDIARKHQDFVIGYIAMEPLNSQPEDDFLVMTPGCSIPHAESLDDSEFNPGAEDALGQQYVRPEDLIRRGCDIIIVGWGICNAPDPKAKAEQYRNLAWKAFEERTSLKN